MSHPIRNPQARKVQVGISLSLAALDMADAVARVLDHPTRSALMEEAPMNNHRTIVRAESQAMWSSADGSGWRDSANRLA